ncbi:MAG: AglZ/HisF2 family acetamidino modification protein [Bacteroidales bacterium]
MSLPPVFRPRVIPVLLLNRGGLYKTTCFGKPKYVGDPRNAVRIFNEKGADELVLLDIAATREGREPDYDVLAEIASEAFMPIAYGGGVHSVEQAARILSIGFEKIVLGTKAAENPDFVASVSAYCGAQSVVVCIDVKQDLLKRYRVVTESGRGKTKWNPVDLARRIADAGVGEIIVQSVDRDGRMCGYDLGLIRKIAEAVPVPVVALGGGATEDDLVSAVTQGAAAAAAAGSMFVFQGPHRAVLITYPNEARLDSLFSWNKPA